jgi:esterase
MASQVAATAAAEPTDNFVTLNGLKLHYLDWGGDPDQGTTVLLHGGSANLHWWDLVAPQLTVEGRVLALDFRGHGGSQWASPPHYGPAGYIGDVTSFLEHLGVPVVLAAHSMGASIALWTAALHPNLLQALIAVDTRGGPPPFWVRWQWRWRQRARGRQRPELPSAADIVRRFRLHPLGSYLSAEALAELALKSAEQLPNGRWAFCFDPETRRWREEDSGFRAPSLRKITVPTLFLRGAQSTLVAPGRARRLRRQVKGSILKEIPHAYHHVPLDNPDATAAAMIDFIRSRRPGQVQTQFSAQL